jgi:general stress protein 26
MLPRTGSSLAAILALLALPATSPAQDATIETDQVLQVARETIVAAGYCFLITLDDSGHPQARVMDPFEPEQDMTVWMATDASTRKVRQIEADPRATLACYDAAAAAYVSMIGRARLVDDLDERERRWKPEWESFYPDGPTGESYLLIELTPLRIEIMSFAHDVMRGPFTPVALIRSGSAWSVEES